MEGNVELERLLWAGSQSRRDTMMAVFGDTGQAATQAPHPAHALGRTVGTAAGSDGIPIARKRSGQLLKQASQDTPRGRRQRSAATSARPISIFFPSGGRDNAPVWQAVIQGNPSQNRQKADDGSIDGTPSAKVPGRTTWWMAKKGQALAQAPQRLQSRKNVSSVPAPGGKRSDGNHDSRFWAALSSDSPKHSSIAFRKDCQLS